ncbi:MAG: ankyrin repeat domain-containing protein [Alphaproteobacteria bacterium]
MSPANRFSGVTPSWNEIEDFCAAAKNGNDTSVGRLIDLHGAAIIDAKDSRGDTALTWAAWGGYTGTVALLLERGAGIDVKGVNGKTALAWAAEGGKQEVVSLLLKKGASVEVKDDNGDTPIKLAKNRGHTVIVAEMEEFTQAKKEQAARRKLEEDGRALAAARLEKLKKTRPPKIR